MKTTEEEAELSELLVAARRGGWRGTNKRGGGRRHEDASPLPQSLKQYGHPVQMWGMMRVESPRRVRTAASIFIRREQKCVLLVSS
jgi:hypothetical protein